MKNRWIIALALSLGVLAQGASAQSNQLFPRDIHGLWWQPTDPGWATVVFDQDTRMSKALLLYDRDGIPTWFFTRQLDCHTTTSAFVQVDCNGAMYHVMGPWFGEATFRPERVRFNEVGEWAGTFQTPLFGGNGPDARRRLYASYTIEGTTHFQPGDMPLVAEVVDPEARFLYLNTSQSGLWGNPGELGWYVGLAQQGNRLVATLLIHDRDGVPRWYVVYAQGPDFGGNPDRRFDGGVFETRGHPFGSRSSERFQVRRVGDATVRFGATVEEGASLRYSIDGVQVSKHINRLP
jgi:hypothetical protein